VKEGWEIKIIGDVCDVIAGQSPEGKFYNSDGEGMPFYQGKKDFGEKFIEPPTTWTSKTTKLASKGDILMSVRAPVGPVNFATEEICIGRGLAAIRSTKELDGDFLFYQLLHLQPDIAGKEGAVFASINKSEIAALPLAYAPLAEQQRIVGILDEAFAGLATAKANAEKNLQNARALFESHLQSVFTQRGEGWVEKSLGECFRLKSGDGLISKSMKAGTYPVFGGNGIAGMHNEFNLSGDNVIIGRVGALCGNARYITDKIWLTDNAFRVVDFCYEFDGAFLTFLLNYKNLRSLARQAAQPVISNSSLKDLVLNFPGLPEQRRITKKLDALATETQRLTSLYQQKLAALAALKKSLLHQAFSGEL